MSFQQRTVAGLVLLEGVNSALLEKSGRLDVPAGLDISAEALVTTWTCRSTGVLTQPDVTAEYAAIHAESWCLSSFLHDNAGCSAGVIVFEHLLPPSPRLSPAALALQVKPKSFFSSAWIP